MISTRTTIACFLGFAAGAALAPLEDMDLTRMPPQPAEVHAQISGVKTPLAAAVATAAAATKALPRNASINSQGNIEVDLFSATEHRVVEIDGATGAVSSNEARPFLLPGAPVQGELVTTASGLQYYELALGEGEAPLSTSQVKVHYSGWTLDGHQFDSSVKRGQPATFPLNGVIKGWTEGVGGMKPGGKRKLLIPGNLAYGANGRPGAGIPPNGLLVFDVELIEIVRR